ncbi:hypothetical protein F383_35883 [Gossypium arboreum]|uniref:Uncharacterized protein n=1 Tax=Gossypium arboreum TaxID=29729 RepID=A0A0B0NBS8_GOSAR|nr:hypothetical protein F383_33171 [Gossypium arboreum]KHG08521.1 hypothetical protein F383_35883 [Gossypium arboreum]
MLTRYGLECKLHDATHTSCRESAPNIGHYPSVGHSRLAPET